LNVDYVEQIQNNSLPNCSVPWVVSLLGIEYSKDQNICSPDDETVLHKHYTFLLRQINVYKLKECLQPCKLISFTGEFYPLDMYGGTVFLAPDFIDNPRKILILYYLDQNVEVSRDVKLVTFNGFISSFGGSMGLFLGFSCLPTMFVMKKFLRDRLSSNPTITQPCDSTIMQPCNATITQPYNATMTLPQ
jgi:hypothetical protein